MPRSPYEPTPLNPAPDRAIWAAYESANRRALALYNAMPIALSHALADNEVKRPCIHCHRRTRAADGQCRACKQAVVTR